MRWLGNRAERTWNMKSAGLKKEMVGAAGFEPATSRTPSVRATRLRHAPTIEINYLREPTKNSWNQQRSVAVHYLRLTHH